MFCGEAALVKHGVDRRLVVTLRCRSWSCEECRPRRRRKLIRQFVAGSPDTFITLTSNPAYFIDAEHRCREMKDAWKVVVKRACRKYGYRSIPYGVAVEATDAGEPHLHILARCKWIDQKWLSEQMEELLGAPIVDIRRVRGAKMAARYLAKYMGKKPHQFGTCKRYHFTRDYEFAEEDRREFRGAWAGVWTLERSRPEVIARFLEADGWFIVWEGEIAEATRDPPPGWKPPAEAEARP